MELEHCFNHLTAREFIDKFAKDVQSLLLIYIDELEHRINTLTAPVAVMTVAVELGLLWCIFSFAGWLGVTICMFIILGGVRSPQKKDGAEIVSRMAEV